MPHTTFSTPIGCLRLVASDDALTRIEFECRWSVATDVPPDEPYRRTPVLAEACAQLDAYFAGTLARFDLPLAPFGTDFQRACWRALQRLAFGDVASYRDIATAVGNPIAVRAVGAANGRNPIPIVIPCHRVIGANGSLVGFGGGLETKRWLLEHEAKHRAVLVPREQAELALG